MRRLVLTVLFLGFCGNAVASSAYISSGRVQLALESLSELGDDPGMGTKGQSCLLCHASANGGPGNLNSSFGGDFRDAATGLSLAATGLPATGTGSLATVFGNADFQALDSDGDGEANGDEFAANTDPASDISGASSGGGDSGGGCGVIHSSGGGSGGPGWPLALLILPLLLLATIRRQAI